MHRCMSSCDASIGLQANKAQLLSIRWHVSLAQTPYAVAIRHTCKAPICTQSTSDLQHVVHHPSCPIIVLLAHKLQSNHAQTPLSVCVCRPARSTRLTVAAAVPAQVPPQVAGWQLAHHQEQSRPTTQQQAHCSGSARIAMKGESGSSRSMISYIKPLVGSSDSETDWAWQHSSTDIHTSATCKR